MDAATYTASLTASPAAPASSTPRPDNIPEKFWDAATGAVNVDALLKSQSELEKQFTQNKQNPVAAEAEAEASPKPDSLEIERPAETETKTEATPLASAVETFRNRWEETKGTVEEADYAPLVEAGLSRDMIDTYLEGIKAQETLHMNAAFALAGGEDNFKAASEWASRSMSDESLATYNRLLKAGEAKAGINLLMSEYQAARPSEGSFVESDGSSSASSDIFRSLAEMTAAINDPRYNKDSAFRDDVGAKIGRSKQAGTIMNFGR